MRGDGITLILSEGPPNYLGLFPATEGFVTCLYYNYFVIFFPADLQKIDKP